MNITVKLKKKNVYIQLLLTHLILINYNNYYKLKI